MGGIELGVGLSKWSRVKKESAVYCDPLGDTEGAEDRASAWAETSLKPEVTKSNPNRKETMEDAVEVAERVDKEFGENIGRYYELINLFFVS